MKKIVYAIVALGLAQSISLAEVLNIYKSPSCGCCGKWAEHMEKSGYKIKDNLTNEIVAVKKKLNVPLKLGSCHTAQVQGYIIEGHVPVQDVQELLKQKPKGVIGIAVPGMPLGSPGMEQGGIVQDYDVVAFREDGSKYIFSSYKKGKRVLKR